MVPLVFLGQDYAISEARIAYVEVPKVALLRTLTGLIVLLWSLEWAIKDRAFQDSFPSISIQTLAAKLRPSTVLLAINNWLRVHPTRWLMLAAGLFFGSTFLSTILSGSFTTSIWGEIPGQDGYSAYTIASYGILFGVIATHLKSQAQMSRLLGAVVLMGVLVGLYGILQHYGHDFFGVTERTGGGTARVTIFMGNAIFAAAVLAMTVPVTLVAAAINFHDENWGNSGPLSKLGQLGRDHLFTSIWALIIAVQLLGLMFTFGRGAWGGAVLAMVVFLSLVVLSLGFRMLIRTGLVLGLAAILLFAFLHWQGSVTIINVGGWLGFVMALLGLAGTLAVLFVIKKFGPTIVFIAAVGAIIAVVGASVLAPSALSGRGGADSTGASAIGGPTAAQVTGRIASIKTDVLGGFVGGRGTHWKVSWKLIKNRPWFEFDDLSLSWLRPLIGYGPDLFRYTYLLESPPEASDLRPLEPDHAHNFFIHQTVEQGVFGGLASLALFASVFGVVGHLILRRRRTGNPVYRLLIIGLMTIIFGRFLEMMVGVARISDLTVLWVLFGLFAASMSFDNGPQKEPHSAAIQSPKRIGRRGRRRAARASAARSLSTGLMFRLAIVAWLVGGIGVVTWQKSINSVRASVAEGQALKHFREGDLESTVEDLDRAIKLAPGVPSYYSNRAQVFLAYQLRPTDFTEPSCDQQVEVPYLVCLGIQSLESNIESVNQQPFNYRARLAAGNSAFNLQLNETALESYANAVTMVPNAWTMRNDLAESQIDVGFYDEALPELDWSLGITGDSYRSARALYLKGKALKELGRLDDAMSTLNHGLSVNYVSEFATASLALLREINTERGVALDIEYFDRKISQNPQDAVAYYFRGRAHLTLGNAERADPDIQTSIDLGLSLLETRTLRAYAILKNGDSDRAQGELAAAVESAPQNALYNAFYGELQMTQGNFAQALNYLENASILNPDLGLAYLVRGKVFLSLGLEESAKEIFDSSVDLDLPIAQDYIDRGEIRAFFGEYDLAFSDLDEAIRINPNQAKYYNARAKTFANMSDLQAALIDFDTAIQIDSSVGDYFINRGVIYDMLGETERSLADFGIAQTLGAVDLPVSADRNPSYFAVYTDTTSTEAESRRLLKLQAETAALRDIEFYSAIRPDDDDYPYALQILGQTYLRLELWGEAAKSLSQLIDLSPTTPEAYRYRGDAYLALKQVENANNDYHQAVILNASDSKNFVARGKGYAEIGKYELARDDFTEAIRLDPDSSDAYKFRGYLSAQTGNYSMAFSDLDHAIEISAFNHDAYFKRSQAYTGLGRTLLALDDLEQAIKLAPTNSDYLYNRGLLRFKLADYDSAIEDFDGAIALKEGYAYVDPRHARPFVDRGKAYLKIGNPSRAVGDGRKAVRLLEEFLNSSEWVNLEPIINLQLADAHDLLGDAHAELGEYQAASDEYRKAYEFR